MKIKHTPLALALALAVCAPMAVSAQEREEHWQDRHEATDHADRPDAWVVTKVKSKLAMSSEVSSLDINVEADDGVVTLHGTVDNRAQEQEALRLARETVGANEVRSALVINPNATDRQRERNEMTPDERREERQERREEQREERRERMQEQRENRQERMEDRQKRMQERQERRQERMDRDRHDWRDRHTPQDARDSMRHDRSMDRRDHDRHDRTSDRNTTDHPDAWLLTKVKAQMLASTDVGGLDINVDVDNGVVVLRGEVETQAEANEAVRIARSTEGVRHVDSRLVVTGN